VAILIGVVLTAACADAPTMPQDSGIRARQGFSSDIVLDPVIVIGDPSCNPYLDANFCQGRGTGTCITTDPTQPTDPEWATVESCPGFGGGGGGSGSGGGTGGNAGADPNKQYHQDTDSSLCPPCEEREATDAEEQTMLGLLPLVQCTDGRNVLNQMIGSGTLMVYTQDNGYYGVWNSVTQRIYISRPRHWNSATGEVDTAELIDTMVHEAVHKLLGHVNGQPSSDTHGPEFLNKMASCGFPQPTT
jgi:hypothetical protein